VGLRTLRPDDRILSMAAGARVAWITEVLSWAETEPAPGEYYWERADWLVQACEYYDLRLARRPYHPPSWALQSGTAALPINVSSYATFARAVAERYADRLGAIIVWNEPNLASEWNGRPPDAGAYAKLLRAAYRAIKETKPQITVVSAGLAPTNHRDAVALDDRIFLREMYEAGAQPFFEEDYMPRPAWRALEWVVWHDFSHSDR